MPCGKLLRQHKHNRHMLTWNLLPRRINVNASMPLRKRMPDACRNRDMRTTILLSSRVKYINPVPKRKLLRHPKHNSTMSEWHILR